MKKMHNLKNDGMYPTMSSLLNPNFAKKQFDPLTGKQLVLFWQNGFSTFKGGVENGTSSVDLSSEANNTWEFQTGCLGEIPYCNQDAIKTEKNSKALFEKRRTFSIFKATGEPQNDGAFSKMIQTWKNPVLGVPKERQLEAQIDAAMQIKQNKFNLGKTKLIFNKENLGDVDVIGQVDKKFIACTLLSANNDAEMKRTLIIIDQHAAHERIRLEALQDEYLQGLKKCDIGVSVDCKDVIPPLIISLSLQYDCSLRKLKYSFERIGIHYTVRCEYFVDGKTYIELSLIAMPTLFIKTSKIRGVSTQKPILEESAIKELFYDHIYHYQEAPVATSVIPPSINNVLCSYACHSAIRFGDTLTIQECISIVKSLARCRLPFQCAHGRPSIAPLVNLGTHS